MLLALLLLFWLAFRDVVNFVFMVLAGLILFVILAGILSLLLAATRRFEPRP